VKTRALGIAAIIIGTAAACAAVALAVTGLQTDSTLEFRVGDAVSTWWVWDMTAKIENRTLRGFYQSDAGLQWYRFTHLGPGKAALELSADGYEPVSVPVVLHRGLNRIAEPIWMRGVEIPGLSKFILFEQADAGGIGIEVRPVGTDGKAVLNHPCLDLWIGCRMYVENKDGAPAREIVDDGASRGEEVFDGRIQWQWDPSADTQFRYSARIPTTGTPERPGPLRVIDYVVVVADPRVMTVEQRDKLMERVGALKDPKAAAAALEAEKGLRVFRQTSWNVRVSRE
jgi:hypothetical protein